MATLVLDMPSGIAGDMLLAALLDAGGDLDRLRTDLKKLGLGPIGITATRVQAGSLAALRVDVAADQDARWDAGNAIRTPTNSGPQISLTDKPVAHDGGVGASTETGHGSHVHRPYSTIRDLLDHADLPERVRARAHKTFRVLAEAEGAVHGVPADSVEFHEVGAIDAIADVVGCCFLLEQLGIDRVVSGPIHPGHGTVRCAHGLMPVPVPAVANMLAKFRAPTLSLGQQTGELTTPTGCALVCALTDRFLDHTAREAWTILATGTGAGHKVIPGLVNAVRCLVVETRTSAPPASPAESTPHTGACFRVPGTEADFIVEIRCQCDDATGEQLGHAVDALIADGARDAFLTPIVMKKGRPGHLLTVLAAEADAARLAEKILNVTPTIGLRAERLPRVILPRSTATVTVEGQAIAVKIVTLPAGRQRAKPEADDVARAAKALGWDFARVQVAALDAWHAQARRLLA